MSFDIKATVKELYKQITNLTYHPSPPRDYIVSNKHNYVSRIVTTFSTKDYLLTYFCCKLIETDLSKGRVRGTFGGWRLGNKIKLKEQQEELFLELESSVPSNSYDPSLWRKNLQDFNKKALQISNSGDFKYFIKFDIANFYNNVNLDILYRKVLAAIPKSKTRYVELLFHFLRNWNKKFEGFSTKTVGLPQDEVGDCSRLLANFYLQDYDKFFYRLCTKNKSKYLRYADDQVIFCPNKEIARKILFESSKQLFKIGLDINSSKVIEFKGKSLFEKYWAFEIFELLDDMSDRKKVRKAVSKYFHYKKYNVSFRESSVLKRLVSINFRLLNSKQKNGLFDSFTETEFLSRLDWWFINKLYNNIDTKRKEILLRRLKRIQKKVNFNSYHYNLKIFYNKNKIPFDNKGLVKIINGIKI